MTSFPEFAAAMLRAGAEDEDDEPVTLPLPEAQAEELRHIAALYDTPPVSPFVRGDEVRWKHRMGPLKPEFRERIAFVFWGFFASEVQRAEWGRLLSTDARHMIPAVDCLLATFDPDGFFMLMAADSRMIERVP